MDYFLSFSKYLWKGVGLRKYKFLIFFFFIKSVIFLKIKISFSATTTSLFPLFSITTRNIIKIPTNCIFLFISRISRLSTIELDASEIRKHHSKKSFAKAYFDTLDRIFPCGSSEICWWNKNSWKSPGYQENNKRCQGSRLIGISWGSIANCRQMLLRFLHTEKSFRNLSKSNRNQIVSTIFRFIWKQTDVHLVLNQSENGKCNLIPVWFNTISKIFFCVCYLVTSETHQCTHRFGKYLRSGIICRHCSTLHVILLLKIQVLLVFFVPAVLQSIYD